MEQELECSKSYFERHHIIPRALGGDNRPNNLISLKASDHLLSHLLLAKIHGGIMWLAVKAMLDFEPNRNKKYRKVTNKHLRNKYNWVRANVAKNYSERFSGQNSANSDKATYVLKNISRESAAGNRTELISLTNLTRSAISALLLGSKDSYNGWYYPGKNPSGRSGPLLGNESPLADKTI